MLNRLTIRNLVIVRELELEFGRGMSALTGETGAGKSILVGALGLVLGERADRTLVRAGEETCGVEAIFELAPVLAGLNATHVVFAAIGNHDIWTNVDLIKGALDEVRLPYLVNEGLPLTAGNGTLFLAALDDAELAAIALCIHVGNDESHRQQRVAEPRADRVCKIVQQPPVSRDCRDFDLFFVYAHEIHTPQCVRKSSKPKRFCNTISPEGVLE